MAELPDEAARRLIQAEISSARNRLTGYEGLLLAIVVQAALDFLGDNPYLRDDANRFFHDPFYRGILRYLKFPSHWLPEGVVLYPVAEPAAGRCSQLNRFDKPCAKPPLPRVNPPLCLQHWRQLYQARPATSAQTKGA